MVPTSPNYTRGSCVQIPSLTRTNLLNQFIVNIRAGFGRVRLHRLWLRRALGANPHPMRILIVEDEEKMAKALRKGLEANDYLVSLARTGEEGFFLATTEDFD